MGNLETGWYELTRHGEELGKGGEFPPKVLTERGITTLNAKKYVGFLGNKQN